MLKLHFKDNRQPGIWVTEKLYCIGSSTDNQLIIDDEKIDPLHAKLVAEDNLFLLKDNNSSTGCFINGQRITQKEVMPGDIIRLGETEIIVMDPRHFTEQDETLDTAPWRLVSDSSWLPGKTFIIPVDRPVYIGRTDQCEITIPGSYIARRHTELQFYGSRLVVKDLGSSSGTFLNEKPITEAVAQNGDRLRLDVYTFRVVAPDAAAPKQRPQITETLTKTVSRKSTSAEPKRWKTRPTSPGNRIEPPPAPEPRESSWKWVFLGVLLVTLIMIAGKFLW